jgi:hypothetical protein
MRLKESEIHSRCEYLYSLADSVSMGLGGCTKAGICPLLCDGNVELLLVELRLLFNDDRLTLLPVLTPLLLLFCDDNEPDARTFGAEVFNPRLGIAGLMKRSLRRP